MTLLLLFGGGPTFANTVAELVNTEPIGSHGYPIARDAPGGGEWRLALELADTAAGTDITWHDLTDFYAGDSYQRGADEYGGRYRAAVAQVQLQTDDDMLAPWGLDTTPLFGVNVELDAGLLMRLSMFRTVSGVTVEWEPLWTGRVETWGDASAARGQIRTHVVTVTDTIADLANVPTVIDVGGGVSFETFLADDAGWLFGVDSYGDTDVVIPFDLNSANAINRMDQGADPFGYVWRSRRTGRLITYPAPWDTTNVARWPNPLLDVYPSGLVFSFSPDFTDIEYIADDDAQPFGIQRTALGVLNSFIVNTPTLLFTDDDPVSEQKYGIRPYQATWVSEGVEQVVIDMLAQRAFASSQALPLRTTLDHQGFWSALAIVDHLDPVTVIHATTDDGPVVTATGTIRNVTEDRTVRGIDDNGVRLLNWQSTVQIDVTTAEPSPALLPVEDLAFLGGNSPLLGGPSSAQFSWTNPTQPDITPTEVQLRVIGRSLIWVPKSYPGVGADGVNIGFLSAATTYTLQVRLVRRVAGVVTAFSATRQVTFTTPAIIIPTPVPDGDSTDVVVGEPPDFTDDCVLEVELQANDGTGWTTVDTFTGAELHDNGNGTWSLTYPIDNTFFENDKIYRFRSREVCGGIDGQWFTGTSFDPPDDWTDPCTTPPALSDPPYSDPDLLVYVPKVCAPDIIEEAVSGIEGVKGDAFAGFSQSLGEPDRLALLAIPNPGWATTPAGIVAYGECPQINGVVGDKTISVYVNVAHNDACKLFECAGMQITCGPGSGSNWLAGLTINTVDGVLSLVSGNLAVGVAHLIMGSFDKDTGNCVLAVDGTTVDSDTFGAPTNTVVVLPIWDVAVPPDSWITDCAVWPRVIATTPLLTVTINQGSGQADPTGVPLVAFDVVFSEAVTGFASGDVALGGTAGATTGVVVDSGDHIHFTVTVTGMTGAGTVVAAIPSNVCVSISASQPNQASTSTDNSVTYSFSTIYAWWDASDTSTISHSGTTVTNVDDKSGNNRDLSAGSGTVSTGVATVNGHNVISYTNAGYLGLAATDLPVKPTVYAVVVVDDNTTHHGAYIIEQLVSGSGYVFMWLSRDAAGVINQFAYMYRNTGGVVTLYTSDWTFSAGLPILVYGVMDGTNVHTRTNTDSDSAAMVGILPAGTSSTALVGNSLAGDLLIGKLCEIIIFDDYHDATKRAQMSSYLQTKWGAS